MRLTDVSVRALKPPEKGQRSYWDDTVSGFGVRVSQGGTKSFVVMHGKDRSLTTIGRYPVLSLSEARSEAKRLLAEVTLGKRRPKSISPTDAVARFLEACATKNKPRTVSDYTRLLNRHFKPRHHNLGEIIRSDLLRSIQKLAGTPSEQHHAFVAIRTFLNWCVDQGYLEVSPLAGVKPPSTPRAREHVLSIEELKAVWNASDNGTYSTIVRLLILTGQRKGEIAALEWEWIDTDQITLPSSLTKNKRSHIFPVGLTAQNIIKSVPRIDDSPYLFPASRRMNDRTSVFNGWGKAKNDLDERSGVTGWTLHDLRRTYSTLMAQIGVSQIVVEKLLNHISGGSQSPIARVYNVYEYQPEMREAVERYEEHLIRSLSPMG